MKVLVVNQSNSDVKYIANTEEIAEGIKNILMANRTDSDHFVWITYADVIENVNELSKFEFLEAEAEEGDELIYFYKEDGSWFRTYTKPDFADTVLSVMGEEYVRWEIEND